MRRLVYIYIVVVLLLLAGCGTVGENGTTLQDVPIQEYDVIGRGGTPVTPDSYDVPIGGGRTIRFNVMNPPNTPTPNATASPTRMPTIIPTVTSAPTDEPMVCAGTVINPNGLNLRQSPSLTAAIIRVLNTGETVTILKMTVEADAVNEWAQVRIASGQTGWVKSYHNSSRYLRWDDIADACLPPIMPIEYVANPLPKTTILWGLHILIGSRYDPIAAAVNSWGSAKALTDSGHIALQLDQLKPSLVTIYRSLFTCMGMTDGPTFPQWDDPQAYYNCIKPYWPNGYDYYEPVNEVGAPRGFGQFTDLMIGVADLASRDGKCILAFSFPAGNPELSTWGEIKRFMQWSNKHPCGHWSDGSSKYHGIALHAPGYMPTSVSIRPDSWINNSWIAGYDVMANNLLEQSGGFGFADFQGGIWLTEWGYTDGYSGNWNDRWTCDQMAAGVKESDLKYKDRPWIKGILIWTTVQPTGTRWTDITDCVDEIVMALN